MSRIAIVGGHGKIALLLSEQLQAAQHEVTSFVRNHEHDSDVSAAGGQPVLLDIEKSTTEEIAAQLRGHDAVVFSAGAGGGKPERTQAVDRDAAIRCVDAAAQAGVNRFLMVSFFGATVSHELPEENDFYAYAQAKGEADDYLRSSDLQYVIVGPSGLTTEEPTGQIDVYSRPDAMSGAGKGAETSRGNVALVLAALVDATAATRTTIDFTDGSTPIDQALAEQASTDQENS